MIEAIWTVELVRGDRNYAAGVMVFAAGRVFGGDADYYYIGRYALNGSRVSLRITVHPYREANPLSLPFEYRNPFDVELAGQVEEAQMVLVGTIIEEPGQSVTVIAKRRHEIPDLRGGQEDEKGRAKRTK